MKKTYNKEKLVYASPILIPLGALAKGSGQCTAGSSVIPGGGEPGTCDNTGTDCTAGSTATHDCTAGPCAFGIAGRNGCSQGLHGRNGCDGGLPAGSGL